MIDVNESNFLTETSTGVVVVDFHTTWCGPCRMLAPVLEQLTGAKVVKVDAVENKALAAKYNVTSVPKLLFMKDGQVIDQIGGLVSKQVIQSKIDDLNK